MLSNVVLQSTPEIVVIESVIAMSKILDLGMSDEEYLQLIAQGRDPVQEHICTLNLIRAGVPTAEARQAVLLLKKLDLSPDEDTLVRRVWQIVRSY